MNKLTSLREMALRFSQKSKGTGIRQFDIFSLDAPTNFEPVLYRPMCCLVLQGAKQALIGDKNLVYGSGDYFVSVVEVPALGRISQASTAKPYVALNLTLDPAVISSVLLDLAVTSEANLKSGFSVTKADSDMLDVWKRFVRLIGKSQEIPIIAPLIERELIFRLLQGPQGPMLRQIAGVDSRLAHIRKSLAWIRSNYTEVIRVEQLAEIAGMSAAVFHRHFKAITAMTPIQYQKNIRLHEARRLLVSQAGDITSVAFEVGYASSSQFNREYSRLFGLPPRRDISRLQTVKNLNKK